MRLKPDSRCPTEQLSVFTIDPLQQAPAGHNAA